MHDELRLGNQVCFRLYSAARLLMQAYTPFLNELGITYPQYLVLMVLWERDAQPVNDIHSIDSADGETRHCRSSAGHGG